MQQALARHDAILRDAIEANNGYVVKATGDGVLAAFAIPVNAIAACLAAQRSLQTHPASFPSSRGWPCTAVLQNNVVVITMVLP